MSLTPLFESPSSRVLTVPTAAQLPSGVSVGAERVAADSGTLYIFDGSVWNSAGGGGSGIVSINGSVASAQTIAGGSGINVSTALATTTVSIATQTANRFAAYDSAGDLLPLNTFQVNTNSGLDVLKTIEPNNNAVYTNFSNYNLNFEPLQNSPNDTWGGLSYYYNIDPTNTGFSFGTAGDAVTHSPVSFNAQGTGDLGQIAFVKNNFQIGNGTDPFDFRGMTYSYGFGQIAANINLTSNMQGYGYQWSMNAAATTSLNVQSNGFYDYCNVGCTWDGSWTSFASGPVIAEITTNHNYSGLNVNPNITLFSGNASFNGVAINPTIGGMGYGASMNCINVSPQTSTVYNAYGINVTLDNVTTFAGVQGTQTKQDLTFTFNQPGEDANSYTLEYIPGGTAGSEVVTNIGQAFTVQIDSGVSTATQIKAALDGSSPWGGGVTTTISGVGSNPQVSAGPTPFAGGLWPGQKKAAYFDGDVEITGSLAFSGGLSIGALQSFGTFVIPNAGGVQSVSTLITQPTVAANVTITGTDLLGVNTAMLLQVGANASVTTTFLGLTALGLPAVLTMDTGSTVDRVGGAAFALSLDSGAAGGTIDIVSLCRALAIPNGTTTVNRSYGYEYDMPFGVVGTAAFGLYIKQVVPSWIEGSLRIGGTTITDDVAAYDLHVDGAAFFENGNLGFYGTTPVAQQVSSGAATAGAVYTATEQAMLQEAYDALRAYGLLS
jgi:hypothetical protein